MRQEYEKYTSNDQQVWQILFDRQIANLPDKATQAYLDGIKIVEFNNSQIPNFEQVNQILKQITGWQLHVVPGLIPNKDFFELLENAQFCASTWLRRMEQLDYLEEPDMFHDVFGHVPLLTNVPFCKFLHALGRIASKHIDNEEAVMCVARIYWFTIEFGLINEPQGLRIYGAGILSSVGETHFSLYDPDVERVAFDVEQIINTPYIKERYQDKYFVIESYEQLYNSIDLIEKCIEQKIANVNV